MLRTWLQSWAAVPSRCAVCGGWPAQPVCARCVARFVQAQPRCGRCALPVAAGVSTCGHCMRQPPSTERCIAAVDYAYPWSGLLTHYKFGGEPGWAPAWAALLRATPGVDGLLEHADLVLPVPLAPGRLRERGFNQALQVARALAPGKVNPDLLLRVRETAPQTSLGRRQREANVRGAFAVDPLRAAQVRGLRAVLVDDVMTSGASVDAAARALLGAGAASVSALVVARTEAPD